MDHKTGYFVRYRTVSTFPWGENTQLIGRKATQAMGRGGERPKVHFQLQVLSGVRVHCCTPWMCLSRCKCWSHVEAICGPMWIRWQRWECWKRGDCVLLALSPCGLHHLFLLIHKQGKMTGLEYKVFQKNRWPQASSKWERERASWGSVTFVRKWEVKYWKALMLCQGSSTKARKSLVHAPPSRGHALCLHFTKGYFQIPTPPTPLLS